MKLVSIIIPVYNGEKHIKKCVEKLLQQTYPKIEIIIVNDGSVDNTESILENLSRQNNNIKLINKSNTGVSDTRNRGIKESKGEYILFLDSDDFLEKDAVEQMIKKIGKNKIDLLIFGFKVLGSSNRLNDTSTLKKLCYSKELKKDLLRSIISTKNNIFGYVWRAMYSKKLLIENKILFPKGIKISEDYMFLLNAIHCSENIFIDKNEYYIYNINEQSMSIKYIPSLLHDMSFVNEWMYEKIVKNNVELLEGYYCCVCNTYLKFVQNVVRDPNTNKKQKIDIIKNIKKEKQFAKYIKRVWFKYKKFNIKTFISLIMFRLNLEKLYIFLFDIKENKFGGRT